MLQNISIFNKNLTFSAVFFGKNNGLIKTQFIKGFHTSIILNADNKISETTGPMLDSEKTGQLLKELAELKENTDSKTVSEYLSEVNSSFSETFPNYSKFKMKDVLSQINSETNTSSIYNEPIIKEVLKPIYEDPKAFLENTDVISKYLSIKNISDGSYTALLNRFNENSLIEGITVESESEGSIVEYENGNLTINVKQTGLKISKSIEYIIKHKDDFDINPSAILPGIGALWMYRALVKAHHKLAFQEVSKLNLSEAAKVDYLKISGKQLKNKFLCLIL